MFDYTAWYPEAQLMPNMHVEEHPSHLQSRDSPKSTILCFEEGDVDEEYQLDSRLITGGNLVIKQYQELQYYALTFNRHALW